eukprot:377605-Rhodomonas_salina.3
MKIPSQTRTAVKNTQRTKLDDGIVHRRPQTEVRLRIREDTHTQNRASLAERTIANSISTIPRLADAVGQRGGPGICVRVGGAGGERLPANATR